MARVVISSGHTNSNPGSTANGLREVDLAKQIAKSALKYLRTSGVITLSVPPDMELLQRIEWVNKTGYVTSANDIAIEIHINDGGRSGIEAWFEGEGANPSETLAQILTTETSTTTGLQNLGARSEFQHEIGSIAFIHDTNPIAVLIECGFIDNPQDANFLSDVNNLDLIGKGIAKGICKYLNVEFRDPFDSTKAQVIESLPQQPNQNPSYTEQINQSVNEQSNAQVIPKNTVVVDNNTESDVVDYDERIRKAHNKLFPNIKLENLDKPIVSLTQKEYKKPNGQFINNNNQNKPKFQIPKTQPPQNNAQLNPRPQPVVKPQQNIQVQQPVQPIQTQAKIHSQNQQSQVAPLNPTPVITQTQQQTQTQPVTPVTNQFAQTTQNLQQNNIQMSREDRQKMISSVYMKVLGHEPTPTDLNYFVNIGVKEEDLIKRMIDSQEHKDLVNAKKDLDSIKPQFSALNSEVLVLRTTNDDQRKIIDGLNFTISQKNQALMQYQSTIQHLTHKPEDTQVTKATDNKSQKYRGSFLDKLFKAFSDMFD